MVEHPDPGHGAAVRRRLLIEGVLIGAVFALVAYGLALVWGVMNVKNLAQGPMVILGGYICWWLYDAFGIHPLIGIFGSIAGLWVLQLAHLPLLRLKVLALDMFVSLLATFGVAYVMEQGMALLFTQNTRPSTSAGDSFTLFDGSPCRSPARRSSPSASPACWRSCWSSS